MKTQVIDITLHKAWLLLKDDPTASLIDVRTIKEWRAVGIPDLTSLNKKLYKISWRLLPDMEINPTFPIEVKNIISNKNAKLLFICRSGGRSREAALMMQKEGYHYCYNIAEGYEGTAMQGNWKLNNLPWECYND